MKRLVVRITIVILSMMLSSPAAARMSAARAPASFEPAVVTLKHEDREKSRYVEVRLPAPEEVVNVLRESGVRVSEAQKNCPEIHTDRAVARSTELDLELDLLVNNLSEASKRDLTESQTALLKRIPLCREYLARLQIVGLLLRGYNIVENASAAIEPTE